MTDLQLKIMIYFVDTGNVLASSREVTEGISDKRKSHPRLKDYDEVRASIKQLVKEGLIVKNEKKYRLSNGTLSYLESQNCKNITFEYANLQDKFKNKVLQKEEYNREVLKLAKTAYDVLDLYV